MNHPHLLSTDRLTSVQRRQVLKSIATASAGLASPAVMSTLANLQTAGHVLAQGGGTGYRALVCVFLLGGNDSFNMLTPYGAVSQTNTGGEYADYVAARGGVAGVDPGGVALPKQRDPDNEVLWKQGLYRIQDSTSGRYFGLHPGMGKVRNLFTGNGGIGSPKLSFVANIGSLVAPTTQADYLAKQDLPLGLFSHSDLIRHWQTADPGTRSQRTGWGGRVADRINSVNSTSSAVSMSIGLNSVSMFQTGTSVVPYVVSPSGATTLFFNGNDRRDGIYREFTERMIAAASPGAIQPRAYDDKFELTYIQTQQRAKEAAEEFNAGVGSVTFSQAVEDRFQSNNPLAAQLKMVAKSIGSASTFGQQRQIFFVGLGGWDHHDEVLNAQATLLPQVSDALDAFYRATVELGVENEVTTFTASDFGRTLTSNGNGTDHAWGGNSIVMGGSVDGGKVFGNYPTDLTAPTLGGEDLDLGRGRLIPTTAVDELASELVSWMGVDSNQLTEVLPNLGNFTGLGRPGVPVFG